MVIAYHSVDSSVDKEEVILCIKSCINSRKGGMPPDLLRDEYFQITGEHIPYMEMGYNSLYHLLHEIKDLQMLRNDKGEFRMFIKNSKTAHIRRLISEQRDQKLYVPRTKNRRKKTIHEKKLQKSQVVLKFESESSESENDRYGSRSSLTNSQKSNSRSTKSSSTEKDKSSKNSSKSGFPGSKNFGFSYKLNSPKSKKLLTENVGSPFIMENPDLDNKKEHVHYPMFDDQQLIGDDFFLQLAIKYIDNPDLRRKEAKSALSCGTCQSGLTIRKATDRFKNIISMSNKLTVCLGTADIYNRSSTSAIISDMKEFLTMLKRKYLYSTSAITLCTIPPLANVNMFDPEYVVRERFNNWLRYISDMHGYNLIDFADEYTDSCMGIDYSLYQIDARNVSGARHAYVLWNYYGRSKAVRLITKCKIKKLYGSRNSLYSD